MKLDKITEREKQIALYIVEGRNNGEIAKILNISIDAVKIHISKFFKKINAKNRTNAAYLIGSKNNLKKIIFQLKKNL